MSYPKTKYVTARKVSKYGVFSSPYFPVFGLNTKIYSTKYGPRKYQNQTDTELSNEYWNIISAKKTSNLSWAILGTRKSYNQSSKRCLLCLNEKLAIALHKDGNMLNQRSEIISKCRPRNKYMLASYDSKD